MNGIMHIEYGSNEWEDMVVLRDLVLRKPLGLSFTAEYLAKEKDDLLLGYYQDGRIIGCLILTREVESQKLQMRQVAIDEGLQGKGYGKLLVQYAEDYAMANNFSLMYCHARASIHHFYIKLGYEIVGDEFIEVSIPHYYMEKRLGTG